MICLSKTTIFMIFMKEMVSPKCQVLSLDMGAKWMSREPPFGMRTKWVNSTVH